MRKVTMGRVMGIALMALLSSNVWAENLYVIPSGAGTHNGSSWSNAFTNFSGVAWGSGVNQLGAGDTLWMAGGTYSALSLNGSGTSAQRIYIKRATAANPACSGAAGWSNSYDAQVVTSALYGTVNYVTIDGQVQYTGIQVYNTLTGEDYAVTLNGANYIDLFNIDIKGVSTLTTNYTGEGRCLSAHAGVVSGLHIAYCQFHGEPTLILTGSQHDMIFEYNKLYDNVVGNPASWHPNVWVSIGDDVNVTWRYNEIWNWMVEGIMMYGTTVNRNWYIYGNVWHDATPSSTSRILEAQYAAQGPIYFYNNTMVNVWLGINAGNGGSWSSSCVSRNNSYWNTPVGGGLPNSDYNFSSAALSEPHGIGSGTNPFVNYTSKDYHIVSTVGAKYPCNKGVDLGAPYNKDKDGNTRGADGTWDIGAYEYATTGIKQIENNKSVASRMTNDELKRSNAVLYDLNGKPAGNIALRRQNTLVSSSQLPGGIYFVETEGHLRKIMVVR